MLLKDAFHPAPEPSPESIGHVLLTRFNMRVYRDRNGLDEEQAYLRWLRHRFTQFERVCLPSIVKQKKRPDLWLLGFDGLRRELVDDVLQMVAPHPWIQPAWQAEREMFARTFAGPLEQVAHQWDVLATTRVDNDDALNVTYLRDVDAYIRSVRARLPELDDFWTFFPLGTKFTGHAYFEYTHSCPHFLTRVTKDRSALEHALNQIHTHLWDDPDRRVLPALTREPMWMQNLHEENVSNQLSGFRVTQGPSAVMAQMFGQAI